MKSVLFSPGGGIGRYSERSGIHFFSEISADYLVGVRGGDKP